jgi:tetratricopeptide (TPR) repeat protein
MKIIIPLSVLFISIFIINNNYFKNSLSIYYLHSSVSKLKSVYAIENNKNGNVCSNFPITISNDATDLKRKGNSLFFSGNYSEAIKYYEEALAISNNFSEAMNNIGLALDNLGKPQEAIVWFDKALAINNCDIRFMYNKGNVLNNLGKPQEAIVWFDKALAINNNIIDAMINKGNAFNSLGRYQDAIVWFDKALSIDNNNIDMSNIISNKASTLGIDLKDYDSALLLIEPYLDKIPKNKGVLCIAAKIYNETGNKDYGIFYLSQLGTLDKYFKCGSIEKSSKIDEPL